MEKKDLLVVIVGLVFTIMLASMFFSGGDKDIVKAIDKEYPLDTSKGNIRIYTSPENVSDTINNIVYIKSPYDRKVDPAGTSILLYDEAVIVIDNEDGQTKIELTRDHETAYQRHRNIMMFYWGGNLLRNGRISTPRSIRNRSIGSSPSRGGGFGFGK